jgi:hypothetical protein
MRGGPAIYNFLRAEEHGLPLIKDNSHVHNLSAIFKSIYGNALNDEKKEKI